MSPSSSIQEGGCTTPPRITLSKLRDENIVPVLALLSPIGVLAVSWVTAKLASHGIEAVSLAMRVGGSALGLAVVLCGISLWRVTDRESRALSTIGLAGNILLLIGAAVYVSMQ
jgi:cell division protein FtsW (lipid II flippase)